MRSIPTQPAQPSALRIYQDVMEEVQEPQMAAPPGEAEQRPNKLLVREAIARKHAARSANATQALASTRGGARKPA